MAIRKTLGGKRLGDGGGMQVDLHEWGKSTHNLTESLKTSLGIGTLVPFLNKVVLPGDDWRIKLYADLISKPTNGPLFGKFKFQVDVFFAPYRLYIGKLHNNKLGVALSMSDIKLPLIELAAGSLNTNIPYDNQQVNPSSLMAYLGIRGIGRPTGGATVVRRQFNATDVLSYFDIYKNYYANTQEVNGYIIHSNPISTVEEVLSIQLDTTDAGQNFIPRGGNDRNNGYYVNPSNFTEIDIAVPTSTSQTRDNIILIVEESTVPVGNTVVKRIPINEMPFTNWIVNSGRIFSNTYQTLGRQYKILGWDYARGSEINSEPRLQSFPLVNLDRARERLLDNTSQTSASLLTATNFVGGTVLTPYYYLTQETTAGNSIITTLTNAQQGLLVKTYQADIFNAWVRTDYINQITTASTIAVVNNQINIDQINLAKKTWEHLNRLVASKGTYRDFIEVAYGVRNLKDFEIPVYLGGMSKKVVFQEIVSNADTAERPLASIAGKGTFAGDTKGGYVELNAEEAGVLMGIMSLTPYIDYTQANVWHGNLKTLDDLHKPAFDGLGYQDNITDQFAWFDTSISVTGGTSNPPTFKSAGKVPAWLNYMTSYNRALGTLADDEMWLILGRRYESGTGGITDLTTYIDPKKFNYIWADARRDAMNFWVEINSDITVRRVMSAKQIPSF